MARTPEQRKYHARKERQYRARKKQERESALMRFSVAVAVLKKHGYSVGEMVDLILASEDA